MRIRKITLARGINISSAVLGVTLGAWLAALGLHLEGGALAVLGFAPMYLYLDRRLMPGLLLGPSMFSFLYHGLGYAVGPLGQRYILGSERFTEEGMVLAQWGAVIGLTTYAVVFPWVFQASHRWASGRKATPESMLPSRGWRGYSVWLLAISVAMLLYGYVSGGSRRVGGLATDASALTASLISTLWYVQMVVFFFLGFLGMKRRGVWAALCFVAYLAYSLFQTLEGSRGPVITALLMIAMGAVYAGASARKVVAALGLAALFFVPLAGVVEIYRGYTAYASRYDEGFGARASALIEASQDTGDYGIAGPEARLAPFIYAISAITVDRVMVYTPEIVPYAGIENLDAIFYAYIPKVILPSRPDLNDSNAIAARYGIGNGTNTAYYYIPSVGEGYRRFGWLGIPVIYSFTASIFGFLSGVSWAKRRKREWAAAMIFVVLQSAGVWSFTMLYAFYFVLFVIPKYFLFFFISARLQQCLSSILRALRAYHPPRAQLNGRRDRVDATQIVGL